MYYVNIVIRSVDISTEYFPILTSVSSLYMGLELELVKLFTRVKTKYQRYILKI